jgi:hypothetical protein
MSIKKKGKTGVLTSSLYESHYTTYFKRLQLFTFTIYICTTLNSLVFSSTKTIEQELERKKDSGKKAQKKKKARRKICRLKRNI